jgi:hypothetical protein
MALLTRKRLLLAKAEATYGTDSSPAGTDAILVRELEIHSAGSDTVERELVRPYTGCFADAAGQYSSRGYLPGGVGW